MGIVSSMTLPAALALSVATLAAASWRVGAVQADRTCHAAQAQAAVDGAKQRAEQVQALRDAERELRGRLDAQTLHHQQELDHLERSKNDLAGRLRAGTVRVSVPVVLDGGTCAAAAATDPGTAAEHQPARAELAPEVALALDGIAADGDAAILELNRCLAAYEAVRIAVAHSP